MTNKIIFINYSNHPSSKWSSEQLQAAKDLCHKFNPEAEVSIMDVPFPSINPSDSTGQLRTQAARQVREFEKLSLDHRVILHVMGEMCYTHNVVKLAEQAGICCVASTTERLSVENPDGTKTVAFKFCQFRQY